MTFWWILYIIDGITFFFVALTVLYILVFSIASMFSKQAELVRSKHQNRFIVIIPSYKLGTAVIQSVSSILSQTYHQRLFDVIVVSDHEDEIINMKLAQSPITLLTPNFEKSSKAKSLQYAILNLPQFKIYDAVVVLDAGNVVEPEFLEQINDAYEMAGTKVIQVHRLSKNRDTSIARLDTLFEEINNSIFRRGHTVLGLSAALNGSGIVYDFEWFKSHIMKVKTAGEDKELEAMIVSEDIFIDYFDNIYVFDEKTRTQTDFNEQRRRWASTQLHAMLTNLRYLPHAVFNRRYDHLDKIIQWIIIPRTIMMGLIILMSCVLPFVYFSLAIKWWVASALALLAFSFATPDRLVDRHWDRDFLNAPFVISWGLLNIVRIGYGELVHQSKNLFNHIHHLIKSSHSA